MKVQGLTEESIGIVLDAVVTTDNTTHGTSGQAAVQTNAAKKSGVGTTSMGSNANIFAARHDDYAKFIVDEDGDIFYDGASATFADEHDDALMVRALDHTRESMGGSGLIRDKWDSFIHYNEQDLIDAEILGGPLSEGGHINLTGLQRLHNGAIWQGYTRQMELQEEVTELKSRLLALEGA